MNKDILLCGVGGQGTVLASKLIASAAMRDGETVHSAETIGMAQRGGSVTSHVRIGDRAYSPLIPHGAADLLLAFEPSEAVRNLTYLKPGGTVITSIIPVRPVTDSDYDGTAALKYLRQCCGSLIEIDADAVCREAGSARVFNVAILGAASGTGRLGISRSSIIEEVGQRVKEMFIEINYKAFEAGERIGGNYEIK